MGDVIAMSAFRDRRNTKTNALRRMDDPLEMRRPELHEHLRVDHGWGGPRSSTKGDMLQAHKNSHDSPVPWAKPHGHGG